MIIQVITKKRPRRLSATFVRTVKTPGRYGEGRGGYGLSLLVKPTSVGGFSKTFSQRLRIRGKAVNLGLGPYPIVSLARARHKAVDNARLVADGIDPRAQRLGQQTTPMFREASETVIAIHAKTWRPGSKTERLWRSRLNEYAYPRIGGLIVSDITSADVLAVLIPIWAGKRATATKVRQYISAVMKWAVVEGHRDDDPAGDSIAAALPKGVPSLKHRQALPFSGVADALVRIKESGAYENTKNAIEFLTLTATRSGEVRQALWNEVDIESATWTIPASRMKGRREHRVPLSTQALAVLDKVREFGTDSEFVFPSLRGKALSDNTLSKLFRQLEIDGTPHGMRSAFRDWAAEKSDAPREIAEMCLAHVEGSAAELAYRRTDYFELRRRLMQQWAEYLSHPR